uniref:Pectinesterase n=1 Tax=Cunninghamia lanceolata TaxID=28977 RepID=A0A6G9W3G7_CUNLA|nr:pectin methylesterase 4 [Cunninghamia lanceolata]
MKKIRQPFAALLLLLAVSACAEGVSLLKSVCNATLYPDVCVSTLQAQYYEQSLRPGSSMKDMAITFVKVSLEEVKKLSIVVSSQSVLLSSDDESKHAAIQDCKMLFKYTVRQLNESLNLLTTSAEWKKEQAEDVQTWLSASLTDQVTCIEGFKDLKDSYAESVRNVSKVVSNSLAIVNSLPVANVFPGQNNRRLLSEAEDSELYFPSWMSPTDRRLLQSSPAGGMTANAVVAKDGTGNYKSISEAVKAAPSKSTSRYIIHVKAGVYAESVEVSKDNIMLVGDGKYATVVTGSTHGNIRSNTFDATGNGFIARDMGFENTAGASAGQSVALRVSSDRSVFYRCSIKSFQDSLYAYSQRQFYRECDIFGTVDFIFGDASAVFQSCNILSRKRNKNPNVVTAQGRSDPNQNSGFSIHNCKVSAESIRTYLGRPWRQYSRTVVMQSVLDGNIDPAGWTEWDGSFALKTLYYAEYMNSGAGAGISNRVKWPGFHIITDPVEASKFTVAQFISGNSWLPSTGVAFQSGLIG